MTTAFIRKKEYLLIFFTCWIVYLFHIGPWPGVNENRYINLTRSIVEEGTFNIDRFHFNTVDKGYYDGHYYAGAAPGPSFLAIPPYLALKLLTRMIPVSPFSQYDTAYYIRDQVGGKNAPDAFVSTYPFPEFILAHIVLTALIPCFLSALMAVMLYHLMGWFSVEDRYRLAVVGILMFGTIMFFYATRFYAHVPAAFCIFLAFYILFAIRHGHLTDRWSVGAGVALGMAAPMEYTIAPLMLVLGIYGLIALHRTQWKFFIPGAVMPVVLLALYQWYCFGHPLTTPYSLPMSPEDPGPHIDQIEVGFHGFGLPSFAALWGLTFSPYRGIFTYSPVLLLAVYGLVRSLLDRSGTYRLEWGVIAAAVILQILFNSAMLRFWWGGYVFGPRYLMPMLPLFMIPLCRSFQWIPPSFIFALGAVSVLINWAGVQYIVSQNAFSSVATFLLAGPSTQFYEFINTYFKTYTDAQLTVSPIGGYLLLAILITVMWRWGRSSKVD